MVGYYVFILSLIAILHPRKDVKFFSVISAIFYGLSVPLEGFIGVSGREFFLYYASYNMMLGFLCTEFEQKNQRRSLLCLHIFAVLYEVYNFFFYGHTQSASEIYQSINIALSEATVVLLIYNIKNTWKLALLSFFVFSYLIIL